MNDKIDVNELNEILPNSIPNRWSRQAYVQGFDCEYINFKKAVNMFERMEIDESIYEGIVEPTYRKPNRSDVNHASHSRQNRGESASSWTRPEKGESAVRRRIIYVDSLTGK